MQVTIKFKPINVGDYKKDLTVEFDCGKPSVIFFKYSELK